MRPSVWMMMAGVLMMGSGASARDDDAWLDAVPKTTQAAKAWSPKTIDECIKANQDHGRKGVQYPLTCLNIANKYFAPDSPKKKAAFYRAFQDADMNAKDKKSFWDKSFGFDTKRKADYQKVHKSLEAANSYESDQQLKSAQERIKKREELAKLKQEANKRAKNATPTAVIVKIDTEEKKTELLPVVETTKTAVVAKAIAPSPEPPAELTQAACTAPTSAAADLEKFTKIMGDCFVFNSNTGVAHSNGDKVDENFTCKKKCENGWPKNHEFKFEVTKDEVGRLKSFSLPVDPCVKDDGSSNSPIATELAGKKFFFQYDNDQNCYASNTEEQNKNLAKLISEQPKKSAQAEPCSNQGDVKRAAVTDDIKTFLSRTGGQCMKWNPSDRTGNVTLTAKAMDTETKTEEAGATEHHCPYSCDGSSLKRPVKFKMKRETIDGLERITQFQVIDNPCMETYGFVKARRGDNVLSNLEKPIYFQYQGQQCYVARSPGSAIPAAETTSAPTTADAAAVTAPAGH